MASGDWATAPTPSGWRRLPIADVVRFPSGQVDPRLEPYRSMVLVAPDHIESGSGRLIAKVSAADQGAISGKYLFSPGDTLYSKIRPYLRKAVLADFEGLTSADMYPLRPTVEVEPRFLLSILLGEHFSRFAEIVSMRSGFPKINREEFAEYAVALPQLAEQRRIAEILDTLDEAIRKTEQLIAKLKQVKQGLLHDFLTRGIDDNGELRDPERHPEQFTGSPVGPIPRIWRVSRLGDEFTLQRGFDITVAEQRPGDVPVVSSSGITSYHNKAMVLGPGVVTGRKGKLGDAYFLNEPFWPHDTTLWVNDFHGNDTRFCALFLKSLQLERFDAATSVPTLNRNFIHPLTVAIPQLNEQRRISEAVSTAEARAEEEERIAQKLRALKNGLMDDLLTGRVRATGLLSEAVA